jgi:hypothetical protein
LKSVGAMQASQIHTLVTPMCWYKRKVTLLDPLCRVQQVGEFSEALFKGPPLSHTLPKMYKNISLT